MIKIKYRIRPFIKPSGQVAIRVNWNSNTSEVTFITGVYAETLKWNSDAHKAKKKTLLDLLQEFLNEGRSKKN